MVHTGIRGQRILYHRRPKDKIDIQPDAQRKQHFKDDQKEKLHIAHGALPKRVRSVEPRVTPRLPA